MQKQTWRSGVKAACRASLTGPSFLFAVFGTLAVLFLGSFQETLYALEQPGLLPPGYLLLLWETALDRPAMSMALPVLCTLPYSAAFLEELKTGFWKASLPRTTRKGYLLGKLLGACLAGGLSIVWGAALFLLLLALLLLPKQAAGGELQWILLIRRLTLLFLAGGQWALAGLWASAATKSRSLAYCAPFLLYYLLVILCSRYFPALFVLDPAQWTSPGKSWGSSAFRYAAALLLELHLMWALAFWLTGERRLRAL